jgi:hypothetical protein
VPVSEVYSKVSPRPMNCLLHEVSSVSSKAGLEALPSRVLAFIGRCPL